MKKNEFEYLFKMPDLVLDKDFKETLMKNSDDTLLTTNYLDTDTLWRYMDLSKYLSLLEKGEMYFSRLDLFADKYEGEYPVEDFLRQTKNFFKLLLLNKNSESSFDFDRNYDLTFKSGFYANCWNLNENESYGMWKSYLNHTEGIAIKTKVRKLKNSFILSKENYVNLSFGKVEYIDYEKDSIVEQYSKNKKKGFFTLPIPGLYKRKQFEFESEFRVIASHFKSFDEGKDFILQLKESKELAQSNIRIKVDLNELIENIYVSPFCNQWFIELVQDVSKRYGVLAPVIQSQINSNPPYR